MKVITVCGSYKYKNEMQEITEKMALKGNCMLTPIELTMHKDKIKLSDAILVVNVDGYIGDSTKSEIEYAKSLNKEILYYTDLK